MSESLAGDVVGPTVADTYAFLRSLALPSPAADDAGRIDRIRALEDLKAALSAAQARETVAFKRSQLATQQAAGVPKRHQGKGISGQVALARRESPHRGARHVGLAEALVNEMPHTMTALTAGEVSEWRATIVCKETACLSAEDRTRVDARMAGRLGRLSDVEVEAETKTHAYTLDPHSVVERSNRAAADRHVSLRPAPDTMARLSALVPLTQGVAMYAALTRHADTRRAAGDPRGRGQLMADTLVERVTGQTTADQTPVEIQLVMTHAALLHGGNEPARLVGHGPLPAPLARNIIRDLDPDTKAWVRRLYTDPTGRLVAMDSHRRLFKDTLRQLLIVRDDRCRTPYCGAPIRHGDHPIPIAHGGQTSETNGQGLCEACNHTKEASGWTSTPHPLDGAGRCVTITTPTGHTYTTTPPPLPGARPPARPTPGLPRSTLHARPLARIDICYVPDQHRGLRAAHAPPSCAYP